MITDKHLEKFLNLWKSVSVIPAQWSDNDVLIILIFDTKSNGKDFLELLDKNDFGFSAFNNNNTYTFEIGFVDYDIGMERKTDIPFGHYSFKEWRKEKRRFFITAGIWINEATGLSDYGGSANIKIDKFFFD